VIETERIIVRRFVADDWTDLHAYLSLAATYRFEPGGPVGVDEAKSLAVRRASADDFFAVCLKAAGGSVVGHVFLGRAEPGEFMTWELGYIFNPRYHNQGLCSEASRLVVAHAFERLHAHRVVAYCDPLNIASWRVLEKVGLRREGYFRKNAFFRRDQDGNPLWHDSLCYAILAEEFGRPVPSPCQQSEAAGALPMHRERRP
jgi:RimJ/RimL family protein N-acetyltransferase